MQRTELRPADPRTLICIFLTLSAGVTACGPEVIELETPPELRDEGLSETSAAVLRCEPSSALGYVSGSPRAITVVPLDGRLAELSTANAFERMRQDAARAGVYIYVVSGFRSNEEQRYLWNCYNQCNCNQCNLAAYPGYSNHQSGLALDLNTHSAGVLSWLNANAARYQFYRTVPSEPWHWEYFGGTLDAPCSRRGSTPTAQGELISPRPGGVFQNGIWFKSRFPGNPNHIRYFVEGRLLGASENSGDGFPVRHHFASVGRKKVRAEAFDLDDRRLGAVEAEFEVVASGPPPPSLEWTELVEGGWYRNGFTLRTSADPRVVQVRYRVGEHLLGEAGDREGGFPLAYDFSQIGHRALLAEGLDAAGEIVSTATRVVRVTPGSEARAGPSIVFISPTSSGGTGRVGALRALASDSVRTVHFSVDGFSLGTAEAVNGAFELPFSLLQTGTRTFEAEARGERGERRASATLETNVR